jgi:hypothetical protein
MTDRIDRYLGGALEWTELTPEERAEADSVERVIHETRAFVDARPVPDLAAGVMRQIEQLGLRPTKRPLGALARLAGTFWTTRQVSFQFRPAYGLLAAAAVVALAVLSPYGWRSSDDSASAASSTVEPKLFVQFRLQAPDASNVRLAGSFTNWQPQYELHQAAPGTWTITLSLPPGVHDYVFVVDGQRWMPDPYAQAVDDGFGGTNSRLALVPPEDSSL